MGIDNKWEQPEQQAEGVGQANQAGQVAGQATDPTQAGQGVSDTLIKQTVSAEVQRVLGELLPTMRQDLTTDMERRVQSMSDKAEHRLSEAQRQKLQMLDDSLSGIKEALGPEYERIRNQGRLEILAQGPVQPQGQQPAPAQQTPAADAATNNQANVYLSQRLGDQNRWTPAQQQQIFAELAQAGGNLASWIAVVDKWAAQKPINPAQGTNGTPQNNSVVPTSVSRLQPMGGGGPISNVSIEQLSLDLNRAYANDNFEEVERISKLIDKVVEA